MEYNYYLPNEEDFLYTISSYLAAQQDEDDCELAALLNFTEISFIGTDQFSRNRWNCYYAILTVFVPSLIFKKFHKRHKDRLYFLCKEFMPLDAGYEIWEVNFSIRLQSAYLGWRDEVLKQLIGQGLNNQASFPSSNQPFVEHEGIRFRSLSEKNLAPHFQASGVLFFPLPLAVCGNQRKEPDYLVCKYGRWAILEVVSDHFHPSVEREADRTIWFQNHHVSVRQYPAERCWRDPHNVVHDFLNWMDGLGR
ncbi:hypothetical protein [Robertmurraya sp.]|uniref:hypothetical protein n=1 Tax=Robertmurraya sp. TaxID=2837525 RepID=UPI00370463ED